MVYYIGAGQLFIDPSALSIVHRSHALGDSTVYPTYLWLG